MEPDNQEPMESMDTSQMTQSTPHLQTSSITSPSSSFMDPIPPHGHTEQSAQDDGEPVLLSYTPIHSPHCQQISVEEYRQQATGYTEQALKELQASPDYRRHTERCHSCGVIWYDGQWTHGCKECGGYALHRPCPICHGTCGNTWKRAISVSHSVHDAHWDGSCAHQDAAQRTIQLLYMHSITDAMEDLKT